MALSNLMKVALAWTTMWGISYIITALITPTISLDTPPLFYGCLGLVILIGVLAKILAHDTVGFVLVGLLFAVLACFMVYGGVASWAGLGIWNVPFANKEIFQVSMALADFIAAAFMFTIAFDKL